MCYSAMVTQGLKTLARFGPRTPTWSASKNCSGVDGEDLKIAKPMEVNYYSFE